MNHHQDLAGLEELAGELNRFEFPSLPLVPRGELPYVDVSLPGSMTAGERIYLRGGMLVWPTGQPAATASHPATAAAIIAHTLAASGGSRP